MRFAIKSLELGHLDVIHAGNETFPLADDIRAVPLRDIERQIKPLSGSSEP